MDSQDAPPERRFWQSPQHGPLYAHKLTLIFHNLQQAECMDDRRQRGTGRGQEEGESMQLGVWQPATANLPILTAVSPPASFSSTFGLSASTSLPAGRCSSQRGCQEHR